MVGVGDPEHRTGFAGRERLQTHPVRQVGLQPAQPALVEALAGQSRWMPSERPSRPIATNSLREVGVLAEQFGELVDDDEQRRQRRQAWSRARDCL